MKKLLLILICLFVFSCSEKQDISCNDLVISGQTTQKKFESKSFDGECVKYDEVGKLTERKSYKNGVLKQKITYNQPHLFPYKDGLEGSENIFFDIETLDGTYVPTPRKFQYDECKKKFNQNVIETKCKVSINDRKKLTDIFCFRDNLRYCFNYISLDLTVKTRTSKNNLLYHKIEFKTCELGTYGGTGMNKLHCTKGDVINTYSEDKSCRLYPNKLKRFYFESNCSTEFNIQNCPPDSYIYNKSTNSFHYTKPTINQCKLNDIKYCTPPDNWSSINGYKKPDDPEKGIRVSIMIDQENGDKYCNTEEKKWDYDFLKNMKNMDLFNSRFDSYPGNLEGLTEESIVGIGSVQDWFSWDLEKKNMSYVNIEKKIKKIKNKYNIE